MKKIICITFLMLLLTSCGKDSKDSPAERRFDYVNYNPDPAQAEIYELSDKLGIALIVANPSDYQNEYKVKYVLRVLERNAELLKNDFKDILKITIGSSFGTQNENKKLALSIDYDASEINIIRYIQGEAEEIRISNDLSDMFRTAPLSVKVLNLPTSSSISEIAEPEHET